MMFNTVLAGWFNVMLLVLLLFDLECKVVLMSLVFGISDCRKVDLVCCNIEM